MPSKFNRPLSLFRALLFCNLQVNNHIIKLYLSLQRHLNKTRDYRQNLKDPKLSPEVS